MADPSRKDAAVDDVEGFELFSRHLPRAIFRSCEFIAAYVAVAVAAELTATLGLVLLKYLLVAAFVGKVIGAVRSKSDDREPWWVLCIKWLGTSLFCLAVMSTAIEAERAAMIQLDDTRKGPALKRMTIRHKYRQIGERMGCWADDDDVSPPCQALDKAEQEELDAVADRPTS